MIENFIILRSPGYKLNEKVYISCSRKFKRGYQAMIEHSPSVGKAKNDKIIYFCYGYLIN